MNDDPLLGADWSQIDQRRRELEYAFANGAILGCVVTLVAMWIAGAFS